jgi:hypothetical protein
LLPNQQAASWLRGVASLCFIGTLDLNQQIRLVGPVNVEVFTGCTRSTSVRFETCTDER